MKKCKLKGCNRKLYAKGYCQTHYMRLRESRTLEPKCLWCGKKLPIGKWKFCNNAHKMNHLYHNNKEYKQKHLNYYKENYTYVEGDRIFTNGCTKEIKESGFVKKEKDRILKDCIKNPKKYLKS